MEGHRNSTWITSSSGPRCGRPRKQRITSSSGPRCGRPRKQHMDNIKQWTKMWKATETADNIKQWTKMWKATETADNIKQWTKMWKATETAHGQHQAVDQDVEGHGNSTWTTSSSGPRCGRPRKQRITSSSGPRCGRPRKQHMDNIKQWTKMWKATETAHGQHQAVDQDVEGHGNSTWTTSSSGPRCGRPRKQHMDNIKQWTKMWKATETADNIKQWTKMWNATETADNIKQWTKLTISQSVWADEDRSHWKEIASQAMVANDQI